MRLYSVANIIIRKFNQQNQVNPSPLVLTLYGIDYQQSGKRNLSDQMEFLGNFKFRWGSHDSIPREIAGYYVE